MTPSAAAPAAEPTSLDSLAFSVGTGGVTGGAVLVPAISGSPALGAAAGSGLTQIAPADIYLPKQHEALFRLLPSLEAWMSSYQEAKTLLPELERLWLEVSKARHALEAAKADVVQAEADAPLHSRTSLQVQGLPVPAVLVQGNMEGDRVVTPDVTKRKQLYEQEATVTDAELAFELLEKVLRANLKGQNQPLLHQLVTADFARLARWGQRYRDAMAASAARQAAASGATMLAAAAGGTQVSAATAGIALPDVAVAPATPGLAVQMGLHSTDEPPTATAGTAAGGFSPQIVQIGAPAGNSTSLTDASGNAGSVCDSQGVAVELAEELAAAAVNKVSAVLLPAVRQYIGSDAAAELKMQLETLERLLSDMGSTTGTRMSEFDLRVLEAVDALQQHHSFLERDVLPALSSPESALHQDHDALRQWGRQYRQAAATAPTRPHGWFLGVDGTTQGPSADKTQDDVSDNLDTAGSSQSDTPMMSAERDSLAASGVRAKAWLRAKGGAAGRLLTAPARAGLTVIDAAADAVRFGARGIPLKV
eukprot:gene6401-6632_t